MKLTNDASMEDMEVDPGEMVSTMGDITPAHSQDTVVFHASGVAEP